MPVIFHFLCRELAYYFCRIAKCHGIVRDYHFSSDKCAGSNDAVLSDHCAAQYNASHSQAIEVNGMVYTSGIIPVVPETGEIPEGSVAQAKQALTNLSNLLEAAGTNMDNVVKTTVFIKEMNDFSAINDVYKTFFTTDFPSRSCVEVARLPKDVMLEIEAIAIK